MGGTATQPSRGTSKGPRAPAAGGHEAWSRSRCASAPYGLPSSSAEANPHLPDRDRDLLGARVGPCCHHERRAVVLRGRGRLAGRDVRLPAHIRCLGHDGVQTVVRLRRRASPRQLIWSHLDLVHPGRHGRNGSLRDPGAEFLWSPDGADPRHRSLVRDLRGRPPRDRGGELEVPRGSTCGLRIGDRRVRPPERVRRIARSTRRLGAPHRAIDVGSHDPPVAVGVPPAKAGTHARSTHALRPPPDSFRSGDRDEPRSLLPRPRFIEGVPKSATSVPRLLVAIV